MDSLVISLVMILIIGKSISAEKEYVSINAPGDLREVTAEDLAKRYDSHQFKPKVYARSNNNQFGGGDYSLEDQREILRVHNEYRKSVSPSASNMDEMVWSSSLASLAQEWSDNCVYEHPTRAHYPAYNGIGQNLYIKYHDRGGDNPPNPIVQPVTLWNNEDRDYIYEVGSCNTGKVCGHYTQMKI
ncbi:GLIPR1 protein 1 [Apostichopus japonicus]|uniref:GLIPR1 protein 1 n=1 Tax=Stichopus japonicus TaxID=307972 RepID=A0A2G8L7B9_STIJA|nr:GLIPR1 protein 1 [Apostichopus japonicus]